VILKQEKVWKTSTHLRGKHEVKDEIIDNQEIRNFQKHAGRS
jgi:hypothetical protein